MTKQIRLIGITVGSRAHQQDMCAAIEADGIVPVVEAGFGLAQLADAFRYQESGAHFGKIAVEF
jgi:NADPH:quinone reductase-like Zn-dependent oxidoreductase